MSKKIYFFVLSSVIFTSGIFASSPNDFKQFKCEIRHHFSERLPTGPFIPFMGLIETPQISEATADWQVLDGTTQFSNLTFRASGDPNNKIFVLALYKDGRVVAGHPLELSLPKGNILETPISFVLRLNEEQKKAVVSRFIDVKKPDLSYNVSFKHVRSEVVCGPL